MTRGLGQRVEATTIFVGMDWRFDLHLWKPGPGWVPETRLPFDPARDTEIDVTGWEGKFEMTRNQPGSVPPVTFGIVFDQPTHGWLHFGAAGSDTAPLASGRFVYVAWLHDTNGSLYPQPRWFPVCSGDVLVATGP